MFADGRNVTANGAESLSTLNGAERAGDFLPDLNHSDQGDRELVRGLVSRLLAKVEPEPQRPRYIHTVAGIGYTFRHEDHS